MGVQLSSTDKNGSSKKSDEENNDEIEALKLPSTSNKSKRPNKEEQFYEDINVDDFKSDLDGESDNNSGNEGEENDNEDQPRSGKSSVFEKSATNINNRLLTGKARKNPMSCVLL